MSGLTKIKPPKKARIGLYSAGLNTNWGAVCRMFHSGNFQCF